MTYMFEQISFIGFGLIASSLARAIKAKNLAQKIAVFDISDDVIDETIKLNLADIAVKDYQSVVKDADLVFICTPVGASGEAFTKIAPFLKKGAIVSDVGSVKTTVVKDIAPQVSRGVYFIPAHPIAGTEKSGPAAGFAELFQDRWCILTPLDGTPDDVVKKLSDLWQEIGSKVDTMTPEHHDKVMAIVSHLPHLIAYTIVATADDMETHLKQEIIKYSASGFRDFTRIAGSDPTMWRDIFLANKDAVLEVIQRFSEDLTALQRAIRWNEGDKLFDLFTKTQKIRKEVIDAKQHIMENEKVYLTKTQGNSTND
ncbi:MAG: prephenate/arogenate dehydrogenase family protein [Alphaproteobacteria bacterium]